MGPGSPKPLLNRFLFLPLALRPEKVAGSAWPTMHLGARGSMPWPGAACFPGPTAVSTQLLQPQLDKRPMSTATSRATFSQVGDWAPPWVRRKYCVLMHLP